MRNVNEFYKKKNITAEVEYSSMEWGFEKTNGLKQEVLPQIFV